MKNDEGQFQGEAEQANRRWARLTVCALVAIVVGALGWWFPVILRWAVDAGPGWLKQGLVKVLPESDGSGRTSWLLLVAGAVSSGFVSWKFGSARVSSWLLERWMPQRPGWLAWPPPLAMLTPGRVADGDGMRGLLPTVDQLVGSFVGRTEELRVLDRFAAESLPSKVIFVTGAAGVGKTTLVVRWMESMRLQGWSTGFVDREFLEERAAGVPSTWLRHLGNWRPRARTIVAFDATLNGDVDAKVTVERLLSGVASLDPKLRVIVIAYTAPTLRGLTLPQAQGDADSGRLPRWRATERPAYEVLNLDGLPAGDARLLVERMHAGTQVSERQVDTILKSTLGNPLFIQLVDDSNNTVPAVRHAVGESLVARGASIIGKLPSDAPHLEAVACAVLCGRIDISRRPSLRVDLLENAYPGAMGNGDAKHLRGIQPVVLGCAFLYAALKALTAEGRTRIAHDSWTADPRRCAATLRSLWLLTTDPMGSHPFFESTWFEAIDRYPIDTMAKDDPMRLSTLAAWADERLHVPPSVRSSTGTSVRAEALRLVADHGVSVPEFGGMYADVLADRLIGAELEAWPALESLAATSADPRVRSAHRRSIGTVIWYQFERDRQRAEQVWTEALRKVDDTDREGAHALASAALALGSKAELADDRRLAEAAVSRLQALSHKWPDDPVIRLRLASTVGAALLCGALRGEWGVLSMIDGRLKRLGESAPDDVDLHDEIARITADVLQAYAEGGQWVALRAGSLRLTEFAARFPGRSTFRRYATIGIKNAMGGYATALRWADVESAWTELRQHTTAASGDADTHVEGLKTAFAVGQMHCERNRWDLWQSVCVWVDETVERFPSHPTLNLVASSFYNSSAHDCGAAGKWDALRSCFDRLKDLTRRFPAEAGIRLRLARTARMAIGRFAQMHMRADVDAAADVMRSLVASYPDDIDVRHEYAESLVNTLLEPIGRGLSRSFEDAARELYRLARTYDTDRKIQIEYAKGLVSQTGPAALAAQWDDMRSLLARLATLAGERSEDVELQLMWCWGAYNAIETAVDPVADDLRTSEEVVWQCSARFDSDRRFQLTLVRAMTAAIYKHGILQRWADMKRAETRLVAGGNRFPDDRDIQVFLMKGSSNALLLYRRIGDKVGMHAAEERIRRIADRFAPHDEVREIMTMLRLGPRGTV